VRRERELPLCLSIRITITATQGTFMTRSRTVMGLRGPSMTGTQGTIMATRINTRRLTA